MVFFEGGEERRGHSASAMDPRRSRFRDQKIVVHFDFDMVGC